MTKNDNKKFYSTGRRKEAAARVWVTAGTGKVIVNNKPADAYFSRPVLEMVLRQPLEATDNNSTIDVWCTVSGGGLSGQAGAVRHGIARALLRKDETLRSTLKAAGFLTRDARTVERKKYGLRGARKRSQYSKR